MKTGKEWLKDLPEPYQSQVECIIKKQHKWILESEYDSLNDFISFSFIWSNTKQGHDYWNNFHETLIKQPTCKN